jgi:PadR family transcriptional regulator AphA
VLFPTRVGDSAPLRFSRRADFTPFLMLILTYDRKGEVVMSFKHTILGLLNNESLSGYEIKKIIEKTPFMYWSGNNNQIYKSLAELHHERCVTKEVQHQEGSPSKKVYSITDDGLEELNNWLLSTTEAPVLRKQIFVKLAFANHLTGEEVESMLESYARMVQMEKALSEKNIAQSYFSELTQEQAVFLDLIKEGMSSLYSSELAWIEKARQIAATLPNEVPKVEGTHKRCDEVESIMNYQLVEVGAKRYLYITGEGDLINQERDALDIISECGAHDTNVVLLEGKLSERFVTLSTGLAGSVLQKFQNYGVRMAVVWHVEEDLPVRFRQMMVEQNKGSTFRIFDNVVDATEWLLAGND